MLCQVGIDVAKYCVYNVLRVMSAQTMFEVISVGAGTCDATRQIAYGFVIVYTVEWPGSVAFSFLTKPAQFILPPALLVPLPLFRFPSRALLRLY
jgi:hypothetical protein